MPDDGSSIDWSTVFTALAGIVTALGAAWVGYRKTQSDARQQAASTAQTTVQSTLDAMKTVVEGLTNELQRRQKELDTLRAELVATRIHERELEIQNGKQEARIAVLETQQEELKRRLDSVERKQDGG
jgi:chromosome segregation ATPase